jgi:hypothetical protein
MVVALVCLLLLRLKIPPRVKAATYTLHAAHRVNHRVRHMLQRTAYYGRGCLVGAINCACVGLCIADISIVADISLP